MRGGGGGSGVTAKIDEFLPKLPVREIKFFLPLNMKALYRYLLLLVNEWDFVHNEQAHPARKTSKEHQAQSNQAGFLVIFFYLSN